MQERWKEIDGCRGYFVSTHGRVFNGERCLTGVDNGLGYIRVTLGRYKKLQYVHRLVASAFIPNPHGKRCVNHIDNNPKNNHVDNLEWVTHQENTDWMIKQGRNKRNEVWLEKMRVANRRSFKAVIGKNMETGEEIYFENLNSVKKHGFRAGDVCRCCKGQRNNAGGYLWRYA